MTNVARLAVIMTALCLAAGCPADEGAANNGVPMADAGTDGGGPDAASDVLDLRRVEPSMGNIAGGITVTLSGTGFADGASVTFATESAASVTFVDETTVRAVVPAGMSEGAVAVTIVNPDDASDTIANGFTYTAMDDPTVGFCQLQAQSPVSATAGTPTDGIFAIVFTDGLTQGAGQGETIEGELGYGSGDDYEAFQFAPMTYNTDKDGLDAGDLANDEYGASFTVQTAGTFAYVARFRLTSSPESWVYCDLDGSDNGIAADQLGVLEVTQPQTPEVDFCQLSSSGLVMVETGQPTPPLEALLFSAGATDSAGQASGFVAELGFGAEGTDRADLSYVSMTYSGDRDGLTPGDLANDAYAAALNIGVAGAYRYAARFRRQSEPDGWVYCDLDGSDNGFANDQLGTIEVTDPPTPAITFCRTQPANRSAVTGDVVDYEGVVFAAAVTSGTGDGGVDSELWWGPAGTDPSTWSNSTAGAYDRDEDGLNAGDQANDLHTASLTAPVAGDYDVAFRFSLDSGTTWSWCDADGSDGSATGYTVDQASALAVSSANLADACNVQFPALADRALSGEVLTFYARVSEAGVTGQGSAPAGVTGDLLVAPAGTDPVTDLASFTVVPGAYFANAVGLGAGEDEFSASWTVGAPGDYDVLWRFSVDGGQTYALCDIDGNDASTGFEAEKVARVIAGSGATPPDLVDFCHVFQTNLTYASGGSVPPVTVEVFEGGVTENNGGANSASIDVQVGWGAQGTNPAVSGAYAWSDVSFARVRPGFVNNYEYEGPVFDAGAAPPVGGYDVAARARLSGSQNAWVYCDTDDSTPDFRIDATTELTVSP